MALVKKEAPLVTWPDWMTRGFPALRLPELPDWDEWLGQEGMKIEEYREGGNLVVKAEMPGIDPDKDVEIVVSDGQLTISAQRKEERKEDTQDFYRSEFRYGQFTRRIPLPAGTTEADVKATYVDGILEIRVPIREEDAAAKKIPVTRS